MLGSYLISRQLSLSEVAANRRESCESTQMAMLEPDTVKTSRHPERLAVVIPCYRVSRQIGDVLSAISPEIWRIYCVDDACPEQSGRVVKQQATVDPRVQLLVHEQNRGVGGAVVTGYRQALDDGAEIIVKLDGDGQMDPSRILRA